jgi:hypothetical protein
MNRKRQPWYTVAVGALLAAAVCAPAARAQAQEPAPLFASDAVLELTLTAPMRTLVNRRSERPEVAGTVTLAGADGATTELDVEVRTRGKSRLEVCSFPPLSINFKRSQVEGTLFAGQNRLKLATLCRATESYEQYLELEYLIYLMYAQVSDHAYRVRPVLMRYVNTERDNEVTEAPAFFIEHADALAARVGMVAAELPGIEGPQLDPRALATYALFQYFIGNTDWSVSAAADGEACCHNTDVLAPIAGGPGLIGVPYDFDQAGLIDTVYALPNEKLGIRDVRDRLYRGFCLSNQYLDATIEKFNAARPAIEAVLASERLNNRSRQDALRYLAEFYESVNDPQLRQREILDECR